MLNRWRPYPKYKPKKDGWYICSIKYNDDEDSEYVMDLYYYSRLDEWRDNRRLDVYNSYEVRNYKGEKMYRDNLCTRKDVIAFKKLPKTYKRRKK